MVLDFGIITISQDIKHNKQQYPLPFSTPFLFSSEDHQLES